MPGSPAPAPKPSPKGRPNPGRQEWTRTVALVVIATVLAMAASSLMATLIVPIILALVLAIALRPVAAWAERRGLGRGGSSVLCTAIVAGVLLVAGSLLVVQAGRVVRESDRYYEAISGLVARATRPLQDSKLAGLLSGPRDGGEGKAVGEPVEDPAGPDDPPSGGLPGSRDDWMSQIRENAGSIGQWVMRGVGGVVGMIGQVVVFLFLTLYILQTRDTWAERIVRAGKGLGMKLGDEDLERMGRAIRRWFSYLLMVAAGCAVAVGLASWALGLPQWPLWGLVAGLCELIPFLGPLIAGAVLVTVAAATGQGPWVPAAMLALYVALQTLESYVITPLLYGRAIRFDPLTVLVGVLFFGVLWGPLGFIAALPTMVLMRGFVEVMPGADPVAALIGDDEGGD